MHLKKISSVSFNPKNEETLKENQLLDNSLSLDPNTVKNQLLVFLRIVPQEISKPVIWEVFDKEITIKK